MRPYSVRIEGPGFTVDGDASRDVALEIVELLLIQRDREVGRAMPVVLAPELTPDPAPELEPAFEPCRCGLEPISITPKEC
jgi:hypothetical protein